MTYYLMSSATSPDVEAMNEDRDMDLAGAAWPTGILITDFADVTVYMEDLVEQWHEENETPQSGKWEQLPETAEGFWSYRYTETGDEDPCIAISVREMKMGYKS